LGLNAGPVPARIAGPAKQGIVDLVADACREGFSERWGCAQIGVGHSRYLAWKQRLAVGDDLGDQPPGPVVGEALHALLDWEKDAIVEVAKEWERIDLSHRKLAHRASRLGRVHASESTFLRVLTWAGVRLPGVPRPVSASRKTPWPNWVEPVPGQLWIYDFTHFKALPGWCSIAVEDMVSRYCLSLGLYPEETSTQVELAFIDALAADGKDWLLEDPDFRQSLACGEIPDNDDRVPVLCAVSDNGPQMTSSQTAQFMAIARIAQHFGRPGTPNDQAWIESFFGHLKAENPHLDQIADPAEMRRELAHLTNQYNTVRLHQAIGYVTPEDEHQGTGPAIRKARADGLIQARANRIATRRAELRHNRTRQTATNDEN
jgi:transposase InsO family protein